jgi:rare lipoprotein A
MKSKTKGVPLAVIGLCAGLWSITTAEAGQSARPATGASYAPPDRAELPPVDPRQAGGPPPSTGPQGSSQLQPGEVRFDRVGYAGYAGPGEGVFALSADLSAGSHAEVTALDSGKTIVVPIRGTGQGLIELSGAAARQLGVTGNPAVRVRRVTISPADAALLAAGQPLPPRADAPPTLLAGLRKQLGVRAAEPSPPPAATPRRPTRPVAQAQPQAHPAPATRGLFVQVAALSSAQRAQALAGQLGGVVRPGSGVYRVQLGPYANNAAAQRARADVARRGYADARIVQVP